MVDMSAQASLAVTRVTDALRSGTPPDVATAICPQALSSVCKLDEAR